MFKKAGIGMLRIHINARNVKVDSPSFTKPFLSAMSATSANACYRWGDGYTVKPKIRYGVMLKR
jgi:hypothetical protein